MKIVTKDRKDSVQIMDFLYKEFIENIIQNEKRF